MPGTTAKAAVRVRLGMETHEAHHEQEHTAKGEDVLSYEQQSLPSSFR
jgi:hypothetical protein